MSKVWTSEELARECKNCEVASAGRIRSQAETISQLRETIALMSRERSKMREALEQIASMAEQIDYQLGSYEETVYAFRNERCIAHNISECARAALKMVAPC